MSLYNSAPGLAAFVRTGVVENYCVIAASTLAFYEHVVTLTQEIEYIWRRANIKVKTIFFMNRGALLSWSVIGIVSITSDNTSVSCRTILTLQTVFAILSYAILAAFSALRVYAASGRSWFSMSVVMTLGLVPVGINIVGYTKSAFTITGNVPVLGSVCQQLIDLSPAIVNKLEIITRTSAITSDVIVIVIILFITRGHFDHAFGRRGSFTMLLRRDGMIYFVLLCFFNILAITLRVLDVADTPSNWLVPASSIIVSRCLLNLQRQKLSGSGLSSNSSRPSFVRSQGALGAHQQISNIQSAPDADTWPVMPLNEVRSDPALDALDNGTTV